MKTAALSTAQLHRNPQVIDPEREALRVRDESRLSLLRGRRARRRP